MIGLPVWGVGVNIFWGSEYLPAAEGTDTLEEDKEWWYLKCQVQSPLMRL